MPEGAVYVGRPTKWGNPFAKPDAIESGYATEETWRAFVVECFHDWLGPSHSGRDWWQGPKSDNARAAILGSIGSLRGKDLACWCRLDQPCHADVLLEIANGPRCEEVTPP
jgi:hypothetical protein